MWKRLGIKLMAISSGRAVARKAIEPV